MKPITPQSAANFMQILLSFVLLSAVFSQAYSSIFPILLLILLFQWSKGH
jgi:hypothetical protein